VGGLHLYRQRDILKQCLIVALLKKRQTEEPSATIHKPVALVAGIEPAHVIIVIAAHRMKPMVIKPLNYVFAFRTSVHQVANREKPVLRFIETNSIKLCPQLGKAAMDITYCNVSAFLVDDE